MIEIRGSTAGLALLRGVQSAIKLEGGIFCKLFRYCFSLHVTYNVLTKYLDEAVQEAIRNAMCKEDYMLLRMNMKLRQNIRMSSRK